MDVLRDEAAWLEQARELARSNDVALLMGTSVFDPTREQDYSNKSVYVDAQGEVVGTT